MGLDMTAVTDFIVANIAWALPLAFLVSFAESLALVSVLVPGTAILLACGALIPSGILPLWPLMGGAFAGAVLGDAVSYYFGRYYGSALATTWPLSRYPTMLQKGEAFLARHGVASIAIGRFCGPVRAVVPLVAGIVKMDARRFWLANIGSALVWAPVIFMPGALLGWVADSASRTEQWLLGGAALAAAIVATFVALRRRAQA